MNSIRKPGIWFPVLLIAGLLFLIYIRLIPFQFVWSGRIPFERLTWEPLNILDAPINILFILPFAFGLAGTLTRAGWSSRAVWWGTITIGTLLGVVLEFTQLFSPERAPSLADVAADALGMAAGYGLFRAWQIGWANAIDQYVTRRNLLIGLGVYAAIIFGLTAYLYHVTGLSGWNRQYPLLIGNEATGDRQWSGEVDDLYFLDRALSPTEATAALGGSLPARPFAFYPLDGQAPYLDSQGNLPPLMWQGSRGIPTSESGVTVGPDDWLATDGPSGTLAERLEEAGTFTIGLFVATAAPIQKGPARIVSNSLDPLHRNVTLGQDQDSLAIRIRTPMSGEGGAPPQLLVPSVFSAETSPGHIIVTYDQPIVRAYTESQPGTTYALSLAPGIAFFSDITRTYLQDVEMTGNPYRFDIAYWSIFLGLATIVGGGLVLAKVLIRKRRSGIS